MAKGFLGQLKRFDAYRQVHSELTEGTPYGGAISLVALISIGCLVYTEFNQFLKVEVQSRMFVDISRDEKLAIHLNMTFPHLPCGVASLDKQDAMGLHEMDVGEHNPKPDEEGGEQKDGEETAARSQHADAAAAAAADPAAAAAAEKWAEGIAKFRISSTGEPLGAEVREGEDGFVDTYNQVQDNEGCNIFGTLHVNKVPGNIHISAHTRKAGVNLYRLNVAHTIHHLSFGQPAGEAAGWSAESAGALGALNGKTYDMEEGGTIRYYTKVVPTTLISLDGRKTFSHQYTANANIYRAEMQMAAVWLQYELSPITVELTEYHSSLSHFLVSICAVVGGVFTVMGLVDGFVHQTYINVIRKIQLGKAN